MGDLINYDELDIFFSYEKKINKKKKKEWDGISVEPWTRARASVRKRSNGIFFLQTKKINKKK